MGASELIPLADGTLVCWLRIVDEATGAVLRTARSPREGSGPQELSAMANERLRLQKELERWAARNSQIQKRLGEISHKEQRPDTAGPLRARAQSNRWPRPISVAAGQRVKVEEFSY